MRRGFTIHLSIHLSIGLSIGSVGCQIRQECRARGDVTTYDGAASVSFGDGDAGAVDPPTMVPANVVVDDYTSDCVYDGMTFPVTIGACTLTLQSASVSYTRAGLFLEGNAKLLAPTVCDLRIGSTSAHVVITAAFFDLTDEMKFVMTGAAPGTDPSVAPSVFSYTFTGQKE